jgi:hypothetical protein
MALRILEALRSGPVGDSGVLVGSSGPFGFETGVPVEAGLESLSALLERFDA